MVNVIDVIEHWGREAQWRHATAEAREAALIEAGFEPTLRAAILGADAGLLESTIGAPHNICCLINAPQEEEEREDEDDDGKKDEEEESEDEEKE